MRWAVLSIAAIALGACDDGGYAVVVHVPGDAARAARVEVSLLRTCGGLDLGEPSDDPIVQVQVKGDRSAALGAVAPGAYGLHARAWDASCRLYAAGCDAVRLEAGGEDTIDVFLGVIDEVSCAPGLRCDEGECTDDPSRDGGLPDAGLDGAPDGGVDAGACSEEGLQVIGTLSSDETRGVSVSGSHAFLAAYTDGLEVVDISDLGAPESIRKVSGGDKAYRVVVSGPWAYAADGDAGLLIVDVSDPGAARFVRSVDTLDQARGLTLSGSHAFVADGVDGVVAIDVSDPEAASVHDAVDTPGTAYRIVVRDGVGFVADGDAGLTVLDVADPGDLALLGGLPTGGDYRDVVLSGAFAMVADGEGGLVIIDVSDPATPSVAGTVDIPDMAFAVALWEALVVVGGGDGIHLVDASSPASAEIVDSLSLPGEVNDIAVEGSHAFVAAGPGGLQIVALDCGR